MALPRTEKMYILCERKRVGLRFRSGGLLIPFILASLKSTPSTVVVCHFLKRGRAAGW
jgi:hypothetical protein